MQVLQRHFHFTCACARCTDTDEKGQGEAAAHIDCGGFWVPQVGQIEEGEEGPEPGFYCSLCGAIKHA